MLSIRLYFLFLWKTQSFPHGKVRKLLPTLYASRFWIQDIDIIEWGLSESEAEVVTQIVMQGSFGGNVEYGFGEEDANNYDPKSNCLTYNRWLEMGYQVKKGEKALQSFIIIERKDKDGTTVRKYPKRVHLFYIKQVEQVGSGS